MMPVAAVDVAVTAAHVSLIMTDLQDDQKPSGYKEQSITLSRGPLQDVA